MRTGYTPKGVRTLKPGQASSDKMRDLIDRCLNRTLKENGKRLDSLLEIAGSLEYLVIEWTTIDYHFKQITKLEGNSIEEIQKITRRCLRLALRHDTSHLIFFDLWRELGQAVRDLVCGNYDNVFRSLRWMLEACVFWADMQNDDLPAREWFELFIDQRDKVTEEEFKRVFSEIYAVNEARLMERLNLKEKYRRPSFNDVIESLPILKNHTKKDVDRPRLRKVLRDSYMEFSKYSHITPLTVKEVYLEPGELHSDFAFYQDYQYDKERFDFALDSIYSTIDLIMAVMILVETDFIGYETTRVFLESLKDLTNDVATEAKRLGEYLPLIRSMIHKNLA